MTTFGVDVSHHQNGLTLQAVVDSGCEFVYAKATEGATYRDPMFEAWRKGAERHGLLFAAYHFVSDRPAAAQVANYAATVRDKTIPVVLDVEPSGTSHPSMALAVAIRDELRSRGYSVPLVYLPGWYAVQIGVSSVKGWSLIQSRYPSNQPGLPSVIYPGDTHEAWTTPVAGALPAIWQFSSTARFPGHAGNVDANAFRGSRRELASRGWFKNYGASEVKAEPAPVPVPVPPVEPLGSFKAVTWNVFNGAVRATVEPILDAQVALGVSLLLGQEAKAAWWPELLASRGFKVVNLNQCLVAWRTDTWTRVAGGAVNLATTPWFAKGFNTPRLNESCWAYLCDDKGRSVDALSYHTAPAVQVAESIRPERRFVSTIESFAYLGQRAHDAETTAVLYGGDDNVDEQLGEGSDVGLWSPLLAGATGLRQVQAPEPTHGKRRRIDDFRVTRRGRLQVGDGWVFDGGADHRGHGREFFWRRDV